MIIGPYEHNFIIEKLVVDGQKWEIIEFPIDSFPNRHSFNCVALNSNEAVILGGVLSDGD